MFTDEEFYKYYITENHSMKDTLNEFNMKYSYFRKYVVEKGFKKNIISNGVKHKIPSKDELINLYINENKTVEELSEYYGINYRTFLRWTKKYDIKKDINLKLSNTYKTNLEKYGSKTKFGTNDFKKWRKDNIDDIMNKMRASFQEKYGVDSYFESKEAKNIWKMGTSKEEQSIYMKLKSVYNDCINGYKSDKYPFNCDFYIPSLDLYIEYQGFYTHGKEPFDNNNEQHIKEADSLFEEKSQYNMDKLYIWTVRDPMKRQTAKNNNLNWIEFFTKKEFDEWFDKINRNNVIEYIQSLDNKVQLNVSINGIKVDIFQPNKKIALKLRGKLWDKEFTNPQMDSRNLKGIGIRLINIYDYEWYNYMDNFKSFIKNIFQSRDKRLIKSEEIVEISSNEMVSFLKDNHLFSDTIKGCSYCYGIYQDNELVAVSGFNKLNGKYDYEWKRFGIKYGWMSKKGIANDFLNKFTETHHGILVDYQQMDRFPFSTDADMGFVFKRWNCGSVSVNISNMKYTRHSFIAEKPLTKEETMKKYGFDCEFPTAGTITWIKEI